MKYCAIGFRRTLIRHRNMLDKSLWVDSFSPVLAGENSSSGSRLLKTGLLPSSELSAPPLNSHDIHPYGSLRHLRDWRKKRRNLTDLIMNLAIFI